ncbi:MAG: putative bifunctional diguanylate cyclase/phosphodiesterase [Lautropia sp.]
MKSPLSYFRVDTGNLALVRAQLAAFTQQVPLLYFVLCTNMILCSIPLVDRAPPLLALWFPAGFVALCLIRMTFWLRARGKPLTDQQAIRRLRGIGWIGTSIGVAYLGWSIALARHGDPLAVTHIAFSVAVTALVCIACLLNLRAAALSLAAVIVVPFAGYLIGTGEPQLTLIAVNLLLAVAAMAYVLMVASRDFDRMINSQIEAERLGAENAMLANLDSLTTLPNRRLFFDRLIDVLRTAGFTRQPFAVGVLDIDGFKSVNDVYGHLTGDRLLAEAGRRLQTVSQGRALVARLGGDEFGFVVFDARVPGELLAFGNAVCATMGERFTLPGAVANVSASIGFAVFPLAGGVPELLYERADYALYFAKSKRRGQPVIFSDEHETELRRTGSIEQCLRNADLERELTLHFQPLFDIDRDLPIAFEALARWHSAELGTVPPGLFIAVAERTELIHKLTHTLLDKALRAARNWPERVHVAFNLSMRDIVSNESISAIEEIVRVSGVAPERIEFEVTESALMADFEQAMLSIKRLRELGTHLSLDDFGTGYSSLSHVHRLPLDQIKIDRSFIVDIETRESSKDILRTVLHLCQNLDISCVVEGTETRRQAEILRDLGCRAMQGFFFARPMPEEDVLPFLVARLGAPAVAPAPRDRITAD